ncbi:hypothetical protein GCM10023149_15100 [Mucilaginibacter gynuensis]|uniref:Uncharacterized protein n=1 Tax=Mucilaginibacter gynuensis TaxID=1302236 RepID=A0ABP8G523_9SPHI
MAIQFADQLCTGNANSLASVLVVRNKQINKTKTIRKYEDFNVRTMKFYFLNGNYYKLPNI